MSSKALLIAWLNDAYAMEQGLEETLKRHADDAKEDPRSMTGSPSTSRKPVIRHASLVSVSKPWVGSPRR